MIWQTQVHLRSLDALHLATAQLAGQPLATADRRLADVGEELGLSILWGCVP